MTRDGGRSVTTEMSRERSWDDVAEQLRELRRRAGDPSYNDIAQGVMQARLAAGATPEAARVARSTVYDTFRTGRARVSLPLVREIAAVLGAADDAVDAWLAPPAPAPEPAAEPAAEHSTDPGRSPRRQVLLLLAVCVAVNLVGRFVVDELHLPVYLDMVGTAIVAMALGPWHGVVVGVTTNVLGVAASGPDSLPFALVNVTGALVWGYGVRRAVFSTSLPRFLGLHAVAALACSLVAVPILMLGFGGTTGHGQDDITTTLEQLTHGLALAVGSANMLTSLADKVVSGLLALVAVSALPTPLRRHLARLLPQPPAS